MVQHDFFKELKVIEFASVLAGPAVGMFFAELGATVIKIENKQGGDLTRKWKQPGEDSLALTSAYFHSVNWNKKSIFLNLLEVNDRQIAMDLLQNADVMIINFKSGDAVKFGLDPSILIEKFPSLIIAEVIGYEDSNRVAYDAVLQAETGYMSMNGTPESGAVKMPVAFIDLFAAHQLKEGILLALLHKQKTGKGSLVHTSLYRSAISSLANQASNWLNNGLIPGLQGSLHPNIAPYGETFTTKDQKQMLLAIGTDEQFKRLCTALGNISIAENINYKNNSARVINRKQLYLDILPLFLKEDANVLQAKFDKLNVPAGIIHTVKEVFENAIAKEMILIQNEASGVESKRVKTVAFQINFHE